MSDRVYNFSPGPAVLPEKVLRRAQSEMLSLPNLGMSVLEISHRSGTFLEILRQAQANLRQLLQLPDHFQILFLQGGSRLQFAMVPWNLARAGDAVTYFITGTWSQGAGEEARRVAGLELRVAWDGRETRFDRLPAPADYQVAPDAAYAYFCSNETVQGVQFAQEPEVGAVPLVCDASSDFLCRPLECEKYGLIYACAQKNAGPAGVTVVIIRDDLLQRCRDDLPSYLSYPAHAAEDSLLNTPPTFAIYLMNYVLQWLLEDMGGLAGIHELNRHKAQLLYDVIDGSAGFYAGHARPEARSIMNVTFRLPDAAAESDFLRQAEARGLFCLKGHRSVGGIRASIYNAMELSGVTALRDFMWEFYKQRGNV